MLQKDSDLDGFSDKVPQLRKIYMRHGSWDRKTLNTAGSLITVSREISMSRRRSMGRGERTRKLLYVSVYHGE
jgi:hypothetical protein